MKLDLSKFKKMHEDADSATLQHKDGHSIKIAKKALSGHLQRRLGELKFAEGGQVDPHALDHKKAQGAAQGSQAGGPSISEMGSNLKHAFGYADGGDVRNIPELNLKEENSKNPYLQEPRKQADVPAPPPYTPEPRKYAEGGNIDPSYQDMLLSGNMPSTTMTTTRPEQMMSMPQTTTPTTVQEPAMQASEPAPSNIILPAAKPAIQTPPVNPMAAYQPGVNQETKGIQGQATTQQNLGKAEAGIQHQQADATQKLMQSYQQSNSEIEAERAAVQQDYKNGHIDPNHFINSQSGGQKVATAIGLLLGGFGAAINHTSNAAQEFLNRQIDRDVEAQQAELNKKDNILKMNQQRFGNLRDATQMTRLMVADSYINKLEEAKAKATTDVAKANADIAIGKLKQQYAPIQDQLAQTIAIRQGIQQGHVPLEQAVPHLVPKEHQAQVFKEIGQAQNAANVEHNMMEAFDKASQENTLANRVTHLGSEPASIRSLNAMSLPLIHDLEGRVNEYEQKTLQDLFPAVGDRDSKIAAKRDALQKFIEQKKAAPTAAGYGISVPKTNSFRKTQK